MFVFGGTLLGLAIAKRNALGGLLIGASLGFGVQVHFWWMHGVLGLGLASLLILRFRLLISKAFWLAAIGFTVVGWSNLYNFFLGGMGNPTGAVDYYRAYITAFTSLEQSLPWLLDGQIVLKLFQRRTAHPHASCYAANNAGPADLFGHFAKLGADHNRYLLWVGLACIGCFMAINFMMPYIRPHYLVVVAACAYLWTAIYIDGLWSRGLKKTALAAALVICVYGAGMFLINGPLHQYPKITNPYQGERGDPSRVLWVTSLHYFPTKLLYQELVKKSRLFCSPTMLIKANLWFWERSDNIGRRGAMLSGFEKDALLVLYRPEDAFDPSWPVTKRKLEREAPDILIPFKLPASIEDKFEVYSLKYSYKK
jgi:hypothetical protein